MIYERLLTKFSLKITDKSKISQLPDAKKAQESGAAALSSLGSYSYPFYSQSSFFSPDSTKPPGMPPADYTTKNNKEPPLDLMNKPPQMESGSKESGPGNSQGLSQPSPQQPPPSQQPAPPQPPTNNSPASKLMQHYQHYPYK